MRLGAINWTAFFEAHPDTPGKLTAFGYAFEHLEIAGYAQLHGSPRAGDGETSALAREILAQEQHAAEALKALFPEAAELALER